MGLQDPTSGFTPVLIRTGPETLVGAICDKITAFRRLDTLVCNVSVDFSNIDEFHLSICDERWSGIDSDLGLGSGLCVSVHGPSGHFIPLLR